MRLSVLVEGEHLDQNILKDVLYDHETAQVFSYKRPKIKTRNSPGTSCTLSSAQDSFQAPGLYLADATGQAIGCVAKAKAGGAVDAIGQGHGPVHSFHAFSD